MTDNEFDRTARAWLADGPNRISDRALRSALDEIHITRQRRAWWPARRQSRMFTMIRIAAVAGAILLAVVSFGLFASGGPGPGPTPVPTPTPIVLTEGDFAALQPGTYVTADPFPVRITFTLPSGWVGNMGGPYLVDLGRSSEPSGVAFEIFDIVYADPCDYSKGPLDPLPGPSVDDLAAALAALPGIDVSTPTDITIDGYRGKQLTLAAPVDTSSCTLSPDGNLRIWALPLGAVYGMTAGERNRIWILDVDGQRVVIFAPEWRGQTAASKAEVQGLLDSIRIAPADPPTASPS